MMIVSFTFVGTHSIKLTQADFLPATFPSTAQSVTRLFIIYLSAPYPSVQYVPSQFQLYSMEVNENCGPTDVIPTPDPTTVWKEAK